MVWLEERADPNDKLPESVAGLGVPEGRGVCVGGKWFMYERWKTKFMHGCNFWRKKIVLVLAV